MLRRGVSWLFALLLVVLPLAACNVPARGQAQHLDWKVQDFAYFNQQNQPFGLSDLKGKVWIADFFFSHCTTVCPIETANMALLQKKLKEKNVAAQLVSFSVDPERDTPETLRQYAGNYHADLSNWSFLSGYTFAEIKRFSEDSFRSAVAAPAAGDDQFVHGTSYYLVNKEGVIVQRYDGYADTPFDQIVKAAKALQ